MPRVSLRRGLLYLSAATTCSLLVVTVHQPSAAWLSPAQPPSPFTLPRAPHLDHPVLELDETGPEARPSGDGGADGDQQQQLQGMQGVVAGTLMSTSCWDCYYNCYYYHYYYLSFYNTIIAIVSVTIITIPCYCSF